jgi:hypothetical protein
MTDDPRLKRVLKRYPKHEDASDAAIDVTALGLDRLQAALRCAPDDPLAAPRALDAAAVEWFSAELGVESDPAAYDYFLHVYVRREFEEAYARDPAERLESAPPEDGPPAKLLPSDMRWVSGRPRDGRERFVAVADPEAGVGRWLGAAHRALRRALAG